MPLVDPSHPLAELLEQDTRYTLDAYLFVLESLSFAQESLGMGASRPLGKKAGGREKRKSEQHVTGQELCEAARQYAQQQYGFLAPTVLAAWGVQATADFGEIVFNMIESGQMRKTNRDRREDFHDVYQFEEAFSRDLSFAVPEAS
jgi:uncharacterized repeat protein (TIGR04138 family)